MSYPLQYFRLAIGNTDCNVIASSSSISVSRNTGKPIEKWYLNYMKENVFQIVNASNNKAITSSENSVTLSDINNSESQNFKIEGVEKDYERYYLYYKITSDSDSSKALTYSVDSGFSLEKYSGDIFQKYKLNLDGLEGFAANCTTTLGEKAGTIGGLLGPTIIANTMQEFMKEMNSEGPKTIVLNVNVDMKMEKNTRVRDYKTIVGSYKYKTIYDCRIRSNDELGRDNPSDNIIFRNLDIQAREDGSRTLLSFYSSPNIWFDHINFNSTIEYDRKSNGQDNVGKFVWVNTPFANRPDSKDIDRTPDYYTVSYCKFTNKYWCFRNSK